MLIFSESSYLNFNNLIATYEIWVSNSKTILCATLCLSYITPKMTVDLRFMEIYFFPWCMLQINLSWPWLEFFFSNFVKQKFGKLFKK